MRTFQQQLGFFALNPLISDLWLPALTRSRPPVPRVVKVSNTVQINTFTDVGEHLQGVIGQAAVFKDLNALRGSHRSFLLCPAVLRGLSQGLVVSRCTMNTACSTIDPLVQDHCGIILKMLSSVGEAALQYFSVITGRRRWEMGVKNI